MSLNVDQYYRPASKEKKTNQGILKKASDVAKKRPPVKMKNPNKSK
jgi:hypothetical protein